MATSYLGSDVAVTSEWERLVIAFEDAETLNELAALSESYGAEIEVSSSLGLVYWKNWDSSLMKRIEKIPGVESIDTERAASIEFTPDDTYFSSTYQWGAQKINAEEAWDFTLGDQSVVIAVLDTGIDYTHDDLTANMWRDGSGYYGYDFINDDNNPMDDNAHSYDNGVWKRNTYIYHGTHVAGIAGAIIDNTMGVAGIAQAKLMAVKVMNESGEGTDVTVSRGIEYAVDNGADIVLMSLGVDSSTLSLGRAVDYARDNGVVMVAAAGNEGSSSVSYPAKYAEVIAVGASTRQDGRATFSNYGSALEIMAPGSQIYSTRTGDQYQYLSGTSTAAPFVAGVVALMLSVNPALTTGEIRSAINSTANDIGVSGKDLITGWGIVDAHAAILSVAGPSATIVDYPSYVDPNSTTTISWVVSGGNGLQINDTYLMWGYSPTQLDNISGQASGFTTPHTFQATDILAPPYEDSVLYLQAVANINGENYTSRLVEIDVKTVATDPLSNLLNSMKELIFDDIGLLNFALILVAIVALATIAASARAKKRSARAPVVRAAPAGIASRPSSHYTPSIQSIYDAPHVNTLPVVHIDIINDELVPEIMEVDEGSRIIWHNRGWAPPPGISIVSGTTDASGNRPDGLFSSGLMIAPGEFWSCVFNKKGYYPYYISNLGIRGKILVRSRLPSPPLY